MQQPAHPTVEAIPEEPFAVVATAGTTLPRRTLKHGDTFILVDSHGDIGVVPDGADGLFHRDTRYLSRLALTLEGVQPLLLGSNLYDDNSMLTVDLTNPDVWVGGRLVMPKDSMHIVRTLFLWQGTAYQRLAISNFGDQTIDLHLAVAFGADFADLFEVRGTPRRRRGTTTRDVAPPAHAHFTYRGRDDARRRPGPFLRGLRSARRDLRNAARDAATVETGNNIFNEVLCRSMSDLCMLITDTPQGAYPYAGIPWYSTTFGRDGLITAMQMLAFRPQIACGVLRRLAAFQAQEDDPLADAQPGKIVHEMRSGEMAMLREVPFRQYYGSVDSTPLFVM